MYFRDARSPRAVGIKSLSTASVPVLITSRSGATRSSSAPQVDAWFIRRCETGSQTKMARRDGLTRTAGRLKFVTAYRVDPGDHGPAAELYAELQSGAVREIFRYDCFANHPHRHHFSADGAEDRVTMEGVASIEQGVAFTRRHFCNELLPALRSWATTNWSPS